MADLPDLYPLFFYDQEEKGISPRTILQRRSDLKGFQAEFSDPRDVTSRFLKFGYQRRNVKCRPNEQFCIRSQSSTNLEWVKEFSKLTQLLNRYLADLLNIPREW